MRGLLASVRPVCYSIGRMLSLGSATSPKLAAGAVTGTIIKASALEVEEQETDWVIEEHEGTCFVTIRNVPITSVGMDFQCASGTHTFTPEMIADLVESQNDPAIKPMRLKIGHDDPRFDGEPALGVVMNMYVGDDGMTAYGDYVGVPAWLAEIMPIAYPNRSIEGAQYVETVTGKKWDLAAHHVALLGVTWPGCSVLSDLPIIFSKEGPEGVTVQAGGTGMKVEASTSVEDIRIAYYEFLDDAGPEYYWWWIRAIYVSPSELIVEDGDGKLWRVPYTVGEEDVTFGDASRVEIEYVDAKSVSTSSVVAGISAARGKKSTAMVYASRAESRPNQEGESMDLSVLCKTLGLPEGTPDSEVLAKAQEKLAASAEEPEGGDPASGTEETTEDQPGTEGGEGEGAGAPASDPEAEVDASVVKVDKDTFASMKDELAAARAEREERKAEENERKVDAAIKAGKILPASRDRFIKLMAADPDGTAKSLEELEPGTVPTHARAIAPKQDADQIAAARAEREKRFPELAARSERRSRVTSDQGA